MAVEGFKLPGQEIKNETTSTRNVLEIRVRKGTTSLRRLQLAAPRNEGDAVSNISKPKVIV